jgi:hypothetical protein
MLKTVWRQTEELSGKFSQHQVAHCDEYKECARALAPLSHVFQEFVRVPAKCEMLE